MSETKKKQGKSVPPITDKVLLAENCSIRTKKPSLPSIQLAHVENLSAFVRLKMRSKFYFQPDIQFSDPHKYQEDMAGLAEGQ